MKHIGPVTQWSEFRAHNAGVVRFNSDQAHLYAPRDSRKARHDGIVPRGLARRTHHPSGRQGSSTPTRSLPSEVRAQATTPRARSDRAGASFQ